MASLRDQLLAAFEVEYHEHVDAIRAALSRFRAGEVVDLREIFRRAHSLKGAARAVDLPEIEEAAHAMEAQFAEVMESGGRLEGERIDTVERYLDAVERRAAVVYGRAAGPSGAAPDGGEHASTEFLRVNSRQVQLLSASVHELSARLDLFGPGADSLGNLRARAEGLARMLERLKSGDALQKENIGGLVQEARIVARGLATAARQQREAARLSVASAGRVRENVERLALVPAGNIFGGLEGMIRDLAAEMGREVRVSIEGLDVQADRLLLQSLRDPVIHLLRNAVAHGVETPDERRSVGKPETGEIGLRIRSLAGRLELTVFDDGRGPDLRRIEEIAISRGMFPRREPGDPPPSPDRLLALVFEPGFSTAEAVGRVAGRGMGLSVVAEAAKRAGGGALMSRRRPWGAEILISAPLSAARQPVLLAFDGDQVYGLPTRALERVVQTTANQLERVDGRQVLKMQSGGNNIIVPVVSLHLLLGARKASGEETGILNVAILRQADQRLGVRVDALRDVRTLTVSALTHPDIDDLVQGAVQLEQGQVGIVINPEALMRRYFRDEASLGASLPAPQKDARAKKRTILVVDDSVTTRTLEKSILEANGFDVILAVDGLDALDRLRSSLAIVDLVVADIEMPRMDGFQLLAALKNDRKLAALPIIMMTSRASPDDVRRGMELGADAYLVKQTFDQRELLETIGQLL